MKFSEFVKKCRTGYPASIPMIVAHIQKYLMENPIIEEETVDNKIEDAIDTALDGVVEETKEEVIEYIEDNPEILPQPETMQGATAMADGAAGIVPQPLAGDNDKALFGDGTYKAIDTVSVMTGATASSDGSSGLVPQPLQGDQDKALYGDGTFKTVPYPSAMTGATASADGSSGLVPQPLQGDQDKALYGDGTFKTVPYPSAMAGATASADGSSGLVPQPLQGDQDKVLYGDGTFKALTIPQISIDSSLSTTSENPVQNKVITNAIADKVSIIPVSLTLTSNDWVNDSDWPLILNNLPVPPIGVSDAKCALVAISNANCADGDDFKLSEYSNSSLNYPLWVYIGAGTIYVATKNNNAPAATVVINGIVLHK